MSRFSTRTALAAVGALAVVAFGLTACAPPGESGGAPADASGDSLGTVKVGALATPAGDILNFVQENLAEEAGLTIEFVEFTDYNTPNTSLAEGSTDANLFQNSTFLANFNSSTGGELVDAGEIYLPTAAFYSDTVDSLDDLEDGATISIPNDPTNEGRALKILAAEGLIETTDEPTTIADVTDNPKNFQFVEIENASLPQAVADSDAAFVTLAFALPAGLSADEAILVEGADSDYYNILATTPELEDDPRIAKLKELLLSDETKAFIEETWGGLVVPAES
ncbi:MetQ/NlpA family ABC transporter substrate-binding protein [Herbiconiux sp. L3-i23]|uniref:MetQ/NlpA family ABC transporter substrate-binding protein n=1 Tax=Herbiconiux sp. L3-i23 TaxID=2905871 RepID=UPI002057C557|nr:MetQ/NlpA family ABC transporter substrate-binding protein [Herbiconiux sp. L3-i23]BDI22748.1 lipoprotein [Herbiconiux sp. L3-i23]